MGSTPGVFVDPAAIGAVAAALDGIARSVAYTGGMQLGFGGACSGRAHAADGALLRDALDGLATDLRAWARAISEVSAQLRCGAQCYIASEADAAAGVGWS